MSFRFVSFLIVAALVTSVACGGKPAPIADAGSDTGVDAGDDGNGPFTTVVTTDLGGVSGNRDDITGVRYFGAIPYAAPPTGANRFRAPQPLTAWSTPREPTTGGKACPQRLPFGASGFPAGEEDCLYLNVVVPYGATANTPVVVWIHGGGFTINSAEQQDRATDGRVLAADQNVIVVTINYRLGPFGFLAHPALTDEQGQSGNYGLLDQLAALRWIRRNIAAFNGDPNRITLYGQSAGGMSICALMASPLTQDPAVVPMAEQPLFHRAVLESAPCDTPVPTLAEAEATGLAFAAATAVGCTTGTLAEIAACLRDPTKLTKDEARDTLPMPNDFLRPRAPNEAYWGPNLDGYVVPAHPVDRIEAGTFLHVPVIAGYTEDEGNTSMHFRLIRSAVVANGIVRATDAATYTTVLDSLFAGGTTIPERNALDAISRYLPASYTDIAADPEYTVNPQFHTAYEQAIAAVHGDMDLVCPARRTLRALEAQGVSVRAYFHTYDDPPFQLTPTFPLGAFHSGDVQFFFGVHAGGSLLGRDFTGSELALSAKMRAYLANFASTGDPNGGTLDAWPAYSQASPTHLVFDTTVTTVDDPRGTECAVWDGFTRARIGTN